MSKRPILQDFVDADSAHLPIRNAAAVAILDPSDRVLVALRNPDYVEEFKDVWSLPSLFLSDSDPSPEEAIRKKVELWFDIQISALQLVVQRIVPRPHWNLSMHLYICAYSGPVEVNSKDDKYKGVRWVAGESFRQSPQHKLGDCALAYLAYLDDCATGTGI